MEDPRIRAWSRRLGIGASFVLAMVASQTALADETAHSVSAESGPFVFADARITVMVGDTVTWTVAPGDQHTITSGTYNASGVHADGLFDSGVRTAGQTFSVTFTEAGEIAYVCTIHADVGMVGRILVQDGGGEGEPADADGAGGGTSSLVLLAGLIGAGALAIAVRLRFARRAASRKPPPDRG